VGDGDTETTTSEPDILPTTPDTLEISEDLENEPVLPEALNLNLIKDKTEVDDCFFIDIVKEQQPKGMYMLQKYTNIC
jgi:hypothetical protein